MTTIRRIKPEDAEAFLYLRKQLDAETAFMMLEPGERTTSAAEVREQLTGITNQENAALFVLETDERLVGYLSASGGAFKRNKHTAYIVIGILAAYQGQGWGSKLFQTLFTWAEEQQIHRLELTVMAHNAAGIALYKKMGFVKEGTKQECLFVNGQWVDEIMMGKLFSNSFKETISK